MAKKKYYRVIWKEKGLWGSWSTYSSVYTTKKNAEMSARTLKQYDNVKAVTIRKTASKPRISKGESFNPFKLF